MVLWEVFDFLVVIWQIQRELCIHLKLLFFIDFVKGVSLRLEHDWS